MAVTPGLVVYKLGKGGVGLNKLTRTSELTDGRVVLPVVNEGPRE